MTRASNSTSGIDGTSLGRKAYQGLRGWIQTFVSRQAITLSEGKTERTRIRKRSLNSVLLSSVLSKAMRALPLPSRLVFPTLLIDPTVDLMQSHFPAVEYQQDSRPEIGFHGSPEYLQTHR